MNRIIKTFLACLSLTFAGCGADKGPNGPDWDNIPKPDKPEESEPTVVMITPTTNIAEPGSSIKNLQYYPGMQINVADKTFTSRLEEVAAAGFKYVELKFKHSYGLKDKSDDTISSTFASMQRALEAKGITVWSIHLPYEDKTWTNISGSESVRTQSVDYLLRVLRHCVENFTTCKNYVLHASKSVSSSATAVSQAHKSLDTMLPIAKQYGVRLCVENLVGSFCYTKEDLNAVITPYSDGFATFDIGHANCKGYDVVEYLIHIGRRLGTVHIHDTIYKSGNDSHMLVGTGDIATKNHRWGEIYKTLLVNNGYRGVFMFEPKDDQKAVDVMATYEEIVRDYLSLP